MLNLPHLLFFLHFSGYTLLQFTSLLVQVLYNIETVILKTILSKIPSLGSYAEGGNLHH